MTKQIRKITHFVYNELFLSINLLILVILTALYPQKISEFPSFVDWNTMEVLLAFMLIVTAIELSGFFEFLAGKISFIGSRRKLAIAFITASAVLAAFLTNDISLFIIIPITLPFKKQFGNKFIWLIVLETVAVNVGSALTPFGNPQNIYIWRHWDVDFWDFIRTMFPLFMVSFSLLILAAVLIFRKIEVDNVRPSFEARFNQKKFILFLIVFIINIWAVEKNIVLYILPADIVLVALTDRRVFAKADWNLLLIFLLLFINVKMLVQIPGIQAFFDNNVSSAKEVFVSTFVLSQFISNVPATLFMSNIADNWRAISYGANVAGSGFIIGSMANMISMRLSKEKKFFPAYHKFALPFTILILALSLIFFEKFFM